MAYDVWPTSINDPDNPIQTDGKSPIVTGNEKSIGRFETDRIETRPVVKASATLLLDPTEFQTFLAFWRDTLNQGSKKFTAAWITIAGYPHYAAKITGFKSSSFGIVPIISLNFDLIPDIRLDPTLSFPDVWPPL